MCGENFILMSHFSPSITNHQLLSVGLIIGWCQNIYFHMWKNATSFPFRSPITWPSRLTPVRWFHKKVPGFFKFNNSLLDDQCLLTKQECYASLKTFFQGKSPGTDGLIAEFCLSFWELLGQELVDSFNYAFERGEMSISQKRGIITLISKKDKNRTLLDNWRPISLLNTDYKVATKSIAARIAKVLPSLIHEDQTRYINWRPLYWSKHTCNSRHYRVHKNAR